MKGISRDEMKAAPGAGSGLKPLMTAVMCIVVAAMSLMCSSCNYTKGPVSHLVLEYAHLDFDLPMFDFAYVNGFDYSTSKREGYMSVNFNDSRVIASLNKNDKKKAKKLLGLVLMHRDLRSFAEVHINAEYSLRVTFNETFQGGDKVMEFLFTPEEIKEVSKYGLSEEKLDREYLKAAVEFENQLCPRDLGNGVTATKVVNEKKNVVYYYRVKNKAAMDSLRANADSINAQTSSRMDKTPLPEMYSQKENDYRCGRISPNEMGVAGKGLILRFYSGSPKKCVDIKYSVDECKQEWFWN